ncbi:MAG: YicC family protein [Alphaproteobacteria bacterium]|nr:YicC family protein [Alphaproteobacteria bacterium]
MTGFARATGQDPRYQWTWEARSVNGRGLDVRCRVPPGFDALETIARTRVAERFGRGSFTIALTVERQPGQRRLAVNRALLDQVLEALRDVDIRGPVGPASLDGLLRLPGIVEPSDDESEEARDRRDAAIVGTLGETLAGLDLSRRREGERLAAILVTLLDAIGGHTAAAASSAAAQPEALRRRLAEALASALDARTGLAEERLAQEVALLVTRGSIREELDRLAAHTAELRSLVGGAERVGRKLGFLCQELHREANTLTSKSTDLELTRHGVGLKVAIDELREQVQNIE